MKKQTDPSPETWQGRYNAFKKLLPTVSNAHSPMSLTLDGIFTAFSSQQVLNAPVPMLVTPSGIVTDVSPRQLRKACFPILVTFTPPKVEGMETFPLGLGETAQSSLVAAIIAPPSITRYDHV